MAKAQNNSENTTTVVSVVRIPNSSDIVNLDVEIGSFGQIGTTKIQFTDFSDFSTKKIKGSFENPLPLAEANKLIGKNLFITSTVTDTTAATNNRTEVIVKLLVANNVVYIKDIYNDVLHEGATQSFTFDIFFKKQ